MNHGIHQNHLYAAAGSLSERRLSVFRKTLKRAAQNVPCSMNLKNTAAARLAVALMKTSVRGGRVS